MATIDTTQALTLAQWAKRLDPDGTTADIVEILGQTNEVLDDMLYLQGNLKVGHRTTIRTGLPSVYWRQLNQAVQSSRSTTAQVDETCAKLESFSQCDQDLADLSGDTAGFRFSESKAFMEAMSNEMARTLFYGNAQVKPEEFTGLSLRYSSSTAGNGQNVIKGKGTGADNMSVWLISWGPNFIHGIFPSGSKAGIGHQDFGQQVASESEASGKILNKLMRVYRDCWKWDTGLVVRDWRYAVRIANLDVSAVTSEDLIISMIKAIHRLPSLGQGKTAFYMNRTAAQALDIERFKKVAGAGMTYMDVDGKNVQAFRGIPIRTVDALTEAESLVA